MTQTSASSDGRIARRQRNIDNVLDVVLEMFAEESLFPTIEQASQRSGLSLRSLYRYFADPGELLEATITRSRERGIEVSRLHAIGEGPLETRAVEFVEMRLRVYDVFGPVYRATAANAAKLPRVREEQEKTRDQLREQFEVQFASELDELKPASRASISAAGDLLTQFDSIDFLRRHRGLSGAETERVIFEALLALFRS